MHFHIPSLSVPKFLHTVLWSVLVSVLIVSAAAALGRAVHNLQGAITEKPDIAIYLLLPNEGLGKTELLREKDGERFYLAETRRGHEIITLRKNEKGEWEVAHREELRETGE